MQSKDAPEETTVDQVWDSIEQAAGEEEDFFKELPDGESAPETAPPSMPIPGEGNWAVDPDSGEVVEIPKVLLKLGWTEFPELPAEPTAKDIATFTAKVDQVTDKIASHAEAISRYDAQAAALRKERVGGREKTITFWTQFLEPMLRKLAPFSLPKYKSGAKVGQYSKKKLILESGSWQFTKAGGPSIFDFAEFKKWRTTEVLNSIAADGTVSLETLIEMVNAGKLTLSLDFQKESAAVRAGKYKDAPGTKSEQENPFAKVRLVLEKGDNTPDDDE